MTNSMDRRHFLCASAAVATAATTAGTVSAGEGMGPIEANLREHLRRDHLVNGAPEGEVDDPAMKDAVRWIDEPLDVALSQNPETMREWHALVLALNERLAMPYEMKHIARRADDALGGGLKRG